MALININKEPIDYSLDMKVISNIKALGIDMIDSAESGHPGIVLGAAPILYRLYNKHLNFDSKNPDFINRDRFIMSAGHGSALLYATLFMSGFDLTIDDLKKFRKYGSKTPGHPEIGTTPGVDASSGPLGQGFATSVGMAIGETYLNERFKIGKQSLVDHFTYVLVSDGDLMEGISTETASLAGSLNLGKLIVLYDSNNMSLDGKIEGVFDEDVLSKFQTMNWDTHHLTDPYDLEKFDNLIEKAKSETDKPSIIKIDTVIGKDSKYQNTNIVHGKPLTKDDIKKIKKKIGIRDVSYTVLEDASTYMKETIERRTEEYIGNWEKEAEKIMTKLDKNAIDFYERLVSKDFDIELNKDIFSSLEEKDYSGRDISSFIINKLKNKDIMCVTTDTSLSTKAFFKDEKSFSKKTPLSKNIACGVREGAASAIANGLSLMGIRNITSTFLSFSNYMIPSIRMAALMNLNNIYLFTHDSVLVGEDGPTHQPIEQIEMLRSIPNVSVFRPGDANEMIGAYKYALDANHPTVIIASKEPLPIIKNTDINKTMEGAYILKEEEKPDLCLIASGSELNLALKISENLEKHMIKSQVISMPSINNFDALEEEKQEKILPKDITKVVLELSLCTNYYKYLNQNDLVFNVTNFLRSGSKEDIIKELEYTEEDITTKIAKLITERK